MHPSQADLLGFFAYEHLPVELQAISEPFSVLAHRLVATLGDGPHGPQLTQALWRLLEAKDCAVRAALPAPPGLAFRR